jgi:uncharacterized protein
MRIAALLLIAASAAPAMNAGPDGHWQGTMERDGAVMTVRFDFETRSGAVTGRFTSESQKALEYPLDSVTYTPPKLQWKLGDSLVFDGVVSADSIAGKFQEGGARGVFTLKPVQLAAPPYRRENITFHNGSVVLAGTMLRPNSPGPHPGIVFVHGSGPESRWGTSLFLADRFARSGVAAVVFDKRGVGESTGDWKTITYQVLAEDVLAGVQFLARQAGVNPRQVGIYGHSEGGTLSPLIASRPGAVAFVIAAAAIGTGPLYEQDLYRTRNQLMDAGYVEPELSRAMDFYRLWIDAARKGQSMDSIEQSIHAAQKEKWYPLVDVPPKDDWLWKWYPPVANYNPLPVWEKVRVPVLLIYGERDRNTPVDPSLAGIGQAMIKARNSDYTPVIIPGAAHNLTIQPEPGKPFFFWHTAPGFVELMTAWVNARFPR